MELQVADKLGEKAINFLMSGKLPEHHVVSKHKHGVVIVVDQDYADDMIDALEERGFNVSTD